MFIIKLDLFETKLIKILREKIWKICLERTLSAVKTKSIIPFETELIKIEDLNLVYELRKLKGKKQKKKRIIGPIKNPFLPWEKELEIINVNKNHTLILNKYPVEIGHMLLITNEWKPQNGWLDITDWESLTNIENDTCGLWFFNNSQNAGASQPHRHLQLLRRKLNTKFFPREKFFSDFNECYENNFLYNSCKVLPRNEFRKDYSAQELNDLYLELCLSMNIGNPSDCEKPLCSYNLIITDKFISIIRRNKESYKGFSINALGFAGYLLITEFSDLEWLISNKPNNLLSNVVSPIKN